MGSDQHALTRARDNGCRVEPFMRTYSYGHTRLPPVRMRSRAVVNGKTCLLSSVSRKARDVRNGAYTRFSYGTLSTIDMILLATMVPHYPNRIFVIPSARILDAYFTQRPDRTMARILIPLDPSVRHRPPTLDISTYEDAWELLV